MTDDLKITYRDPAKLKGYDRNARIHSELQIKAIRRSIDEFGFTNPVLLVDDGDTIGAGHGRVAAALLDPPLSRIPTVTLTGLSAEQWRAYIIADNQLAITGASWDLDVLRLELGELHLADFDVTLTGLSAFDLGELNIAGFERQVAASDPEDAPEPPGEPVTVVGDVWLLGDHRIMCGDSLSEDDVAVLLDGVVPDLANCDPPYGIGIVKRSAVGGAKPFGSHTPKNELNRGNGHSPGRDGFKRRPVHGGAKNQIIKPGVYAPIIGDDTTDTAHAAYAALVKLGIGIIVLWGGNYYADRLPASRCWLVWDKENSGSFADAELAWTNQDRVVKVFRHQWNGLIKASERGERRVHPTQKPVALAEWVSDMIAPKAKTVLDLFLGSGSVLIAAERKGLVCFGMEMSEAYVDVAVLRWQALTGKTALHADSGLAYTDVAASRAKPP